MELREIESSKQAFSQARKKLHYEAYIELNEKYVELSYNTGQEKLYKEYRLLSIDGSDIRLANTNEICQEFGCHNIGIAMGTASILYDVENHITIDSNLGKHSVNEREQAKGHIEKLLTLDGGRLRMPTIVLFDRGYPSVELLCYLQKHGVDYVMRCSAEHFITATNAFSSSGMDDSIIAVELPMLRKETGRKVKQYFTDLQAIHLRMIRLHRTGKEDIILLSSLVDRQEFPYEEFDALYHKRWEIETQYNYLKSTMELENFASKTALGIRQEFYATILSANICLSIAQDAEEEYWAEHANKENNYTKINRRVATGLVKNEIIPMLYSDIPIEEIYDTILQKIKKHRCYSKPDRSFKRKVKHARSYHMNYRPLS